MTVDTKPNVLMFVVDDVDFSDLGYVGSAISNPNTMISP